MSNQDNPTKERFYWLALNGPSVGSDDDAAAQRPHGLASTQAVAWLLHLR